MAFIKRAFCKVLFSFVNFNEKFPYCNGRRHGVTCSRPKCYVRCDHNIIYEVIAETSYDKYVSIENEIKKV